MEDRTTFEIEFQPIGKRMKVAASASIFEAARNAGIELASSCGGEGNCGLCQIIILDGQVTSLTGDEEFILSKREILGNMRLACCTWALSDLKIQIPKSSLITGQRLQIASNLKEIAPEPMVRAYPLELTRPTLHDTRSDLGRLLEGLRNQYGLDNLHAHPNVIRSAPGILREHDWQVEAILREGEIVSIAPPATRLIGYAVDLGTTKIAAYLVDLSTGHQMAAIGAPNPQIGYGEDVISRLNYIRGNPEGGSVLDQRVRQTLDEILGDLVNEVNVRREDVVEACVVGNTAMTHLLLELPVHQLAKAPFVAATAEALDIRADRLGLNMAPGAFLHIPPCIGGFVGADHVAMILACDMDQTDKVTLGIDIGTNTEIALRKPGITYLTSASCASGPAFEGAHVHDGMRAATGAIEKVRITENKIEMASLTNARAVMRFGMRFLVARSLFFVFGLAILALGIALLTAGHPPLWLLVLYLMMTFFGIGILFGNLNALAMEPLGHLAGVGAAVVGSLSTLISMVLGTMIGRSYDGTILPLVASIAMLTGLSIFVVRWTESE